MSVDPIPSDAQFITPAQCARLFQKPVEHILLLIETGRLPAIDIGVGAQRDWAIQLEDITLAHRDELPASGARDACAMPRKPKRPRKLARLLETYDAETQLAALNGTPRPPSPAGRNGGHSRGAP